jgi:hypothetical protein
LECIRYEPSNSDAYVRLALTLDKATRITLPDGRTRGAKALYLEAIRSNRSNGSAYYHLAAALGAAEVVTLLDGRKLNKQQLYLEALRLNPASCDVLRALADTL